MIKRMPWFRAYTEMIDDEKLRLLAFEDRWHFVALLCCKGAGLLDGDDSPSLLHRKLALKLGLASRELDAMAGRLAELGLIDRKTFQPVAWEERQFHSDSSAERMRAFRARKKKTPKSDVTVTVVDVTCDAHSDVTVTPQDTDTDTERARAGVYIAGAREAEAEPSTVAEPSTAEKVAEGLRRLGLPATSKEPSLVAAVAEGVTLKHLAELHVTHPSKPAGYLITTARRQLAEKAQAIPTPPARASPKPGINRGVEETPLERQLAFLRQQERFGAITSDQHKVAAAKAREQLGART